MAWLLIDNSNSRTKFRLGDVKGLLEWNAVATHLLRFSQPSLLSQAAGKQESLDLRFGDAEFAERRQVVEIRLSECALYRQHADKVDLAGCVQLAGQVQGLGGAR